MASVAELIQAAEAQKSPFVSMAEGAAQGFGKAQDQGFERARQSAYYQLAGQEEQRRQQENQRKQYESMLKAANEEMIRRNLLAVESGNNGMLPSQKYEREIGINSSGPYMSYKTRPSGAERTVNKTALNYPDDQGRLRIGAWDPQLGKLIKSSDDSFADTTKRGAGGRGGETPQEKVDRATIARLQQAQKESGAKGVPVSAELLKQGKEAADRLGLPTYEQTVEEDTAGVSGFLQRMVPGGKTGKQTRTDIGLGMAEGLSFNSVQDAEKANLPRGTRITIKGRPAVID